MNKGETVFWDDSDGNEHFGVVDFVDLTRLEAVVLETDEPLTAYPLGQLRPSSKFCKMFKSVSVVKTERFEIVLTDTDIRNLLASVGINVPPTADVDIDTVTFKWSKETHE